MGIEKCSPTIAFKVWCLAADEMAKLKKRFKRDTELAFWYHLDPRRMTPVEKLGYSANLERCKAQDTIHRGNFDPTNHRAVYDLYLAAYDDEDLARKAQSLAAEAYMDRRCNEAGGEGDQCQRKTYLRFG